MRENCSCPATNNIQPTSITTTNVAQNHSHFRSPKRCVCEKDHASTLPSQIPELTPACNISYTPQQNIPANMAEQQGKPTFKLVLVGDGGTGKVRISTSDGSTEAVDAVSGKTDGNSIYRPPSSSAT